MEIPQPSAPIRIYADGVYDVFHIGHAKQLEQAKKAFKNVHVIVGVSGQEETERLKGKTLMNEYERTEAVRNCKWINEVLCPCPWVISKQFIEDLQIDFVAHDALPYSSAGSGDIYQEVKDMGKFYETKRTPGVSTSDLIVRIIKNRDIFYNQLLELGYSREALNLSLPEFLCLKVRTVLKKVLGCQKRKKKEATTDEKKAKKN